MSKCFFYVRNSKITNQKVIDALFDPEGIGSVSLKDGKYTMEIKFEGRKTTQQLGYFFGCLVPKVLEGLIDKGFGGVRDKDDAVLVIEAVFLKTYFTNPDTGETIQGTKKIKDLSVSEMATLITGVIDWAAEYLGVNIAPPNKQNEIEWTSDWNEQY